MRKKEQLIAKLNKTKLNMIQTKKTAKISASSSKNVGKYELLTTKDVPLEKDFLRKTATIKRFECSPLSNELKKEIGIAKKQYQGLAKVYEFDKKVYFQKINKQV